MSSAEPPPHAREPEAVPRLLFAPVSGARGMGEYARCLALAQAIVRRWPQVSVRFLLSREAPYARDCAFPVESLPASVTLAPAEAIAALEAFRPQLLVLDNAGRTQLLRAAAALGTRVIYVSSRSRQRRRAFRLGWMQRLEEHWIAYPAQLVGRLGPFERAKLRLLGRPRVRFLDTLLPPADVAGALNALRGRGEAMPGGWPRVVFVPGGGSAHPGAELLPQRFAAAALDLARAGASVAFVAGPAFATVIGEDARLALVRGADVAMLRALFEHAELVVANGGDTLVQALALGCACLAVPIAADQRARIERCVALGVIEAPSIDGIADACRALLYDAARRQALRRRVAALGWGDRMDEALAAIGAILGLRH